MYLHVGIPAYRFNTILSAQLRNLVWSVPTEVPFHGKNRTDFYTFISPDGRKLFFLSLRPYLGMDSTGLAEMWFAERNNNNSWGEPQKIDFGGKDKGYGGFLSVALSGNIYFTKVADRTVRAVPHLFCSKYENGVYNPPVKLNDSVNFKTGTYHPYVAPDESYLIFELSSEEMNGFGGSDLYISFRKKNGEWSKAKNIGSTINSPNNEMRPYVTFDGKYLFFISNKANLPALSEKQMTIYDVNDFSNRPGNGSQDIYWVSADFIAELKKQFLDN